MNSSLTHANMKGRIIICHLFESGHVFLRPLSYKWPLLLPDPQASQVSGPRTRLQTRCGIKMTFAEIVAAEPNGL